MQKLDSKDKVELLITTFYDAAVKNEIIGHFFKHVDFEAHMPRMIGFWSFLLIDEAGYKGNVIEKHMGMPLEKIHFDEWVRLFVENAESLFDEDAVKLIKEKLVVLRWTMESKLETRNKK
ncbi:MAG: hemoglobin [Psychromonas sp.]|jgi:hemoglobin